MLATALIVFREVLEAALVVGIVFAATRGVPSRTRWVLTGIAGGITGAVLVALFANTLAAAAAGMGQELFNASILFAAVLMLGWHNVWMSQHGREMSRELKSVGAAVKAEARPIHVLAIVVGVAVLREGSELVLFLYGIAAAQGTSTLAMLAGFGLGLGFGVLAGAALYFGLVRFAGKYLFSVTGILVLFLASGMAALGARALAQAGYLPSLGEQVWDTTWLAPDAGPLGNLLRALMGYTARPDGIQVLFFGLTFATIGSLMILIRDRRPRAAGITAVAALCALGIATSISSARAEDFSIYSPTVEPHEFGIELRGNQVFDGDPAIDGAINSIAELEITPNNWWHTAVLAEFEKEPGGKLEHTATAWENIFQLTPQGKYWLDAALYVEYEATRHDEPDILEYKLLLEKAAGPFTFTLNPIWETELGGSGATEFRCAARAKWRLDHAFEPAIEFHGVTGRFDRPDRFEDQTHLIGPVVLGEIDLMHVAELKYEAGYLFGATHGSPDGAAKFKIELERRF